MIMYIFMFCLSITFIFISLSLQEKRKVLKKIFLYCGLLITCIFAGLRDISIGFDTHFYAYGLFERVSFFSNPLDYINGMKTFWQITDIAYLLLTFIITKVFKNFHILLFFIEVLIVFPTYKSITNYGINKKCILISMTFFYLFWYNASLNMIRQSIALSFSLLSISYVNINKPKKSFFFNIIAIGFHKTALFTAVINVIFLIFNNKKISDSKKTKISYLLISGSFFLTCIIYILTYAINNNIMILSGNHYLYYLKNARFDFSFIDTTIYVYIYVIFILLKSDTLTTKINYMFFKSLSLCNIILLQIGALIPYGERITFYLLYPLIINILPILISDNNTKKTLYIRTLTLLIFVGYWFFVFAYLGIHSTIPYKFYF